MDILISFLRDKFSIRFKTENKIINQIVQQNDIITRPTIPANSNSHPAIFKLNLFLLAVNDLCGNGGTCVNLPGKFRCDCPPGITGRRCEFNINECQSSPCKNEATCLDHTGYYTCVCMPGNGY